MHEEFLDPQLVVPSSSTDPVTDPLTWFRTPETPDPPVTLPRKVAIVGWAPSYLKAPWNDPTWEKWILNDMYRAIPDGVYSRVYEVHSAAQIAHCEATKEIPENHVATLSSKLCEIHTLHPDVFPNSTPIPVQQMVDRFGPYFTCSISYMVADCILEGVDEIGIWGVDLAVGSEYSFERPGVEYLLGFARGRGISVYIPPESDLLSAISLYGFDEHLTGHVANMHERREKLRQMKDEIIAANSNNNNNLLKVMGALEILDYEMEVWMPKGRRREVAYTADNPNTPMIQVSDGAVGGVMPVGPLPTETPATLPL